VSAYLDKRDRGPSHDPYEALTPRERQVLHLSDEGLPSAAVAQRLGISARTAETHRARAMRKLALRNQTDLVRWAIDRGIVPLAATGRGPRAGEGTP
jgi:DNA-binding CsgD family transcriptional regulator